jgi:hypothetical protein
MTRLAVFATIVVMLIMSTAIAVDAQRGGGGGRGGGTRGGGGVAPPASGRGGGGRGGFRIQGRINVPPALPSINRPSFPIDGLNRPAFPLSGPLGFGRAQPAPFDARPGTYTRLHQFGSVPYGYGIPYDYGYPSYGISYAPESTYDKMFRTREPEVTEGALFLDITPETAMVFIDTAYVGAVADVQTRGIMLSGGRHYVDLEAPGYDRKTIEVSVRAGEPLRYRFDMTPERRAEAILTPPRPPQTMYTIASCYAGNRPPVAANLPKGCDISKVRVIRPQPQPRNN